MNSKREGTTIANRFAQMRVEKAFAVFAVLQFLTAGTFLSHLEPYRAKSTRIPLMNALGGANM